MKKKCMKMCSILLSATLFLSTVTAADTQTTGQYDLQTAIRLGINNSILLQQIGNKVKLSKLKSDAYEQIEKDLLKGNTDLQKGEEDANNALGNIDDSQDQLNRAKIDILNGILPAGADTIRKTVAPGLPELVISPKDNIKQKIDTYIKTVKDNYGVDLSATLNSAALTETIKGQVTSALEQKQNQLDDGRVEYEKNILSLVDGKIDYKIAKSSIASSLADKLDISELKGLSAGSELSLLRKMADASVKITTASEGIYRNQIALMIENSYYNMQKAKKMVEVKGLAVKRAEKQYQFAKESYESGVKAKDDMLLAQIYYTGTKLEYQKAQDDYSNARIEFMKNMGTPMDQTVDIKDEVSYELSTLDLQKGLSSGLENRLEIIKATQQLEVYDLNRTLVQYSYKQSSPQYQESVYLYKNVELELDRVKRDVESSIRQSYNTMTTMGAMLDDAKQMVDQAKECLSIAQYKYSEGFSTDSSLMKKLGIEASSGTALEVISAEENLAQVEQKYIEIVYGYNLAKAKYLNDIGYLTY